MGADGQLETVEPAGWKLDVFGCDRGQRLQPGLQRRAQKRLPVWVYCGESSRRSKRSAHDSAMAS